MIKDNSFLTNQPSDSENLRNPSHKMLSDIFELMMQKGMKSLTMDFVSSRLAISKRTLYETFPSKKEMISRVLEYNTAQHFKNYKIIIQQEENILLALLKIYTEHKNFVMKTSVEFFRDLEEYAAHARIERERHENLYNENFSLMLRRGIEEGVFRPDINLLFSTNILRVQMEALKRMEEFFPRDISLPEVYDNIILGFLRSLVSRKGFDMLEEILQNNSNQNKN